MIKIKARGDSLVIAAEETVATEALAKASVPLKQYVPNPLKINVHSTVDNTSLVSISLTIDKEIDGGQLTRCTEIVQTAMGYVREVLSLNVRIAGFAKDIQGMMKTNYLLPNEQCS